MFIRRQYQMGGGGTAYTQAVQKATPQQQQQLMNTAASQTSNVKESLISGWNSLLGALADPNVLGASQGVGDVVSQVGAAERMGEMVSERGAQAAPAPEDTRTFAQKQKAGTTGAGALMRIGTGIGRHPGYGGQWWKSGKGAGGSLGQESRAARRAKQKQRRLANRQIKKDPRPVPAKEDPRDYAEGGRVSYAIGGGVISKLASKILRQYERGGRSFSKAETKARNEINKELRDISAKKDLDRNEVDNIYRIKNRLEYIDDEIGGVGDDIALQESREIQDLILEREDLLFELEEIVEGPMSEWTAKSRAAFTDPSWRMEVGQPLGQRYTTPNFDEIDPADTVISEFQRKTRKPKAFGGLLSTARTLIKKFKNHPEVKKIDKEIKKHEKWIQEGGPAKSREEAPFDSDLSANDRIEMSDEFAEMELSMLHQEKIQILKDLEAEEVVGEIERNPYPNREDFQEGGELDAQMSDMMEGPTHTMPDGTVMPGATHGEYEEMMQEEAMVPDERMEEDFVDYVTESALEPEDTMYLEEALAADPRLSEIFDQVVETASEFSGSGPVEGPGSEVSDSIPARLSDGEFVITSKATEEIGPENLQGMMEQAEMDADVRREAAEGGMIVDEDDAEASYPVKRTVDPTEREMRKLQLAANPRTQYRTVYG